VFRVGGDGVTERTSFERAIRFFRDESVEERPALLLEGFIDLLPQKLSSLSHSHSRDFFKFQLFQCKGPGPFVWNSGPLYTGLSEGFGPKNIKCTGPFTYVGQKRTFSFS